MTPEMPERVIAYRSNVDGSIMVVPLMDGEEPNIDETLFIRATLLTEARELLERAKNMIDPNSLAHSQISNFLERLRPL